MSLKILGVNGSARVGWNTSKLVQKALEGARSMGAVTDFIELGKCKSVNGCIACMGCKKGKKVEGKCVQRDDISGIIDKLKDYDGLIIGTPIYMGLPGALSHAFMERALYPFYHYGQNATIFPKKIKTGLLWTSGAPTQVSKQIYGPMMEGLKGAMAGIFGACENMIVGGTLMTKNPEKYDMELHATPEQILADYNKRFPKDLEEAFEFGKKIATK